MHFSHLGGVVLVEKHQNWIAKYPERLTTRVFVSLEGFCMYMHYGCVGAISIIGESTDSLIILFLVMWRMYMYI